MYQELDKDRVRGEFYVKEKRPPVCSSYPASSYNLTMTHLSIRKTIFDACEILCHLTAKLVFRISQ